MFATVGTSGIFTIGDTRELAISKAEDVLLEPFSGMGLRAMEISPAAAEAARAGRDYTLVICAKGEDEVLQFFGAGTEVTG